MSGIECYFNNIILLGANIMEKTLSRQHVVKELAEKMLDNHKNYLKKFKKIEEEAKTPLNMSTSVLHIIATQLNAKRMLKIAT